MGTLVGGIRRHSERSVGTIGHELQLQSVLFGTKRSLYEHVFLLLWQFPNVLVCESVQGDLVQLQNIR